MRATPYCPRDRYCPRCPRCPRGVPGEIPEATSASRRAAVTAHATVTAHAGAETDVTYITDETYVTVNSVEDLRGRLTDINGREELGYRPLAVHQNVFDST